MTESYDQIDDPINYYFVEKAKMIVGAPQVLLLLNPKRKVFESAKQGISGEAELEAINAIIKQHNETNQRVENHVKNQLASQEDDFNKKMNERRERSISRSFNKQKKSVSERPKFIENLEKLQNEGNNALNGILGALNAKVGFKQ